MYNFKHENHWEAIKKIHGNWLQAHQQKKY